MSQGLELAAGVRQGDVLGGKYRVERVLGVGGMGVVVAARHIELDSRVALKFLLPELVASPEAVARFAGEARAAVQIQNEHVARVLDVGALDNGAPYMVMEFLEGRDLSTWLQQRGPLPAEQAVEFVLQACVAVADAHRLGIVHRDLKPANLFCIRRSDGQFVIKVLDFGISKLRRVTDGRRLSESAGMSVTKTSALMGSPLYMSPEQMRSSKDVNAQTDIWALGVILFELLTGRVPFLGETVTEVAIHVATQSPPPIRSLRPDAIPGLEAVIFKCLEKQRDNRYPTVADLAVGLLPFGSVRAKALVERISGIVGTDRLSASAAGSSARVRGTLLAPGSVAPWSSLPHRVKGKAFAGGLAAIGVLGAIGALILVRTSWMAERASHVVTPLVHPVPYHSDEDVRFHLADPASVPERLSPLPAFELDSLPSMTEPKIAPTTPGTARRSLASPAPPTAVNTGSPSPAPSASTQSGESFLKLNSIPPSTCFLDGRQLGSTPLMVSVTPGTHAVTFVDLAQQHTKTLSVTLDAGETKIAVTTFDLPAPTVHGAADGGAPTATSDSDPNPKPHCNPPYTVDAKGHSHFKPECTQ
jgi:eukaryotic-like serine/threonine-protein kinase